MSHKVRVSEYCNTFFNIRLNFTDEWRVFSWRNRKSVTKAPDYYQQADDDLPENDGDYKALLLAFNRIEESPEIISSQLSMEVHRQSGTFKLTERLPPQKYELSRHLRDLSILDTPAQELETTHAAEGYVIYQKVVVWQTQPSIWLSACLRGDSAENYCDAIDQFHSLKLKDSDRA